MTDSDATCCAFHGFVKCLSQVLELCFLERSHQGMAGSIVKNASKNFSYKMCESNILILRPYLGKFADNCTLMDK